MTDLARAFVAVVPPPAALDAIDAVLHEVHLPAALRWVPREQWHITLRFLGRVHDLDSLVARLELAFAASVGLRAAVRLGGGGTFPSLRHAAVVWVGVLTGADGLVPLARALGTGGGDDPVPGLVTEAPERREFRPHLTLARPRGQVDVASLVDALDAAPPGPGWEVHEAVLFESVTTRGNLTHVPRARFNLPG